MYSKKTNIIIGIICLLLATAVLIIGALQIINSDTKTPKSVVTKFGHMAIDKDDKNGIIMPISLLPDGVTYEKCKIESSDKDVLTIKNGKLTLLKQLSDPSKAIIKVYKWEVLLLELNVDIVTNSKYINTGNDLLSIPSNSSLTYIVNTLIDLQGSCPNITDFGGKFYGNYNKIINLKIVSNQKGLFASTYNALITSFSLQGKIEADITSETNIGGLVGYAFSTDISYIDADIDININVITTQTVNIGGVVGFFDDTKRRENVDASINIFSKSSIKSDVKISFLQESISNIGLAVGKIKNGLINYTTAEGNISLKYKDSINFYVGGLVGQIVKEYDAFGQMGVTHFDTARNLTSKVKISILADNSIRECYVGGVIGRANNVNILQLDSSAIIDFDAKNIVCYVGGIIAKLDTTCNYINIGLDGLNGLTSSAKLNCFSLSKCIFDQFIAEKILKV